MLLLKKITLKSATRKAGHPDAGRPHEPNARPRSQNPVWKSPRKIRVRELLSAIRPHPQCYFKHCDFILVCSEAAQMGRINLCYYRKIRGPRFRAACFSCLRGGQPEAGTMMCEASESVVSFLFWSLRAFHKHCHVSWNQTGSWKMAHGELLVK